MNFSKRNKSIIDFLFIMALFGAFAITGLFVVLFGAKVYKATVTKMDENYASRTALSYVTEKIRSHDYMVDGENHNIEIRENDGQSVLLLRDIIGDRSYVTYMYVEDGYLKEFTTSEEYDFNYSGGSKILSISKFEVDKVSDALYKFNIVDTYNNETDFYAAVYSLADRGGIDE